MANNSLSAFRRVLNILKDTKKEIKSEINVVSNTIGERIIDWEVANTYNSVDEVVENGVLINNSNVSIDKVMYRVMGNKLQLDLIVKFTESITVNGISTSLAKSGVNILSIENLLKYLGKNICVSADRSSSLFEYKGYYYPVLVTKKQSSTSYINDTGYIRVSSSGNIFIMNSRVAGDNMLISIELDITDKVRVNVTGTLIENCRIVVERNGIKRYYNNTEEIYLEKGAKYIVNVEANEGYMLSEECYIYNDDVNYPLGFEFTAYSELTLVANIIVKPCSIYLSSKTDNVYGIMIRSNNSEIYNNNISSGLHSDMELCNVNYGDEITIIAVDGDGNDNTAFSFKIYNKNYDMLENIVSNRITYTVNCDIILTIKDPEVNTAQE